MYLDDHEMLNICIEQIKKRKTEGGHYVPKVALYAYIKRFEMPHENEGFELIQL